LVQRVEANRGFRGEECSTYTGWENGVGRVAGKNKGGKNKGPNPTQNRAGFPRKRECSIKGRNPALGSGGKGKMRGEDRGRPKKKGRAKKKIPWLSRGMQKSSLAGFAGDRGKGLGGKGTSTIF